MWIRNFGKEHDRMGLLAIVHSMTTGVHKENKYRRQDTVT